MENQDIRWHQRLGNYNRALVQLNRAADISKERELTELEQQGLIQSFEFTHELAWKVMKDFFNNQGNTEIYGSKDATRLAFKNGLINDGEVWMEMIVSRNQTSHTYDEVTAQKITTIILRKYIALFNSFSEKMNELRDGEQQNLFEE